MKATLPGDLAARGAQEMPYAGGRGSALTRSAPLPMLCGDERP